ncbi:uncharacterized protein LOC126214900 [Schistocerca nitens]|uniref:uncharacterized protein LOC126214900 n=1 Tax=Schistocerca nitens TaxID=7011 RepID=UPI0021184906|nr:uncharacterized protein LOC126214900 [Schistocerca nitens]
MWFSLSKTTKIEKQKAKFLGIVLDNSLTWNSHVDHIVVRLSRVIYLLKRLMCCVTFEYVRTAYFAFFQSVLRYGLILWGNSRKINEIMVIQKKAIRVMAKVDNRTHCKPLFIKYRILTVINLYILDSVNYILAELPNLSVTNERHGYYTRTCTSLLLPQNRLAKTNNSHKYMSIKIYNKLSKNGSIKPDKLFKDNVHNFLLTNTFYSLEEFLEMPNINLKM